ncbi:hypothetical protein HK096_002788, partial [Nowakowskiella sp. JEL0078]
IRFSESGTIQRVSGKNVSQIEIDESTDEPTIESHLTKILLLTQKNDPAVITTVSAAQYSSQLKETLTQPTGLSNQSSTGEEVTYYVSNSNLSQTETTFTPSISPSVTNSNKPQFTETPSLLSFIEIVEKLQSFTETPSNQSSIREEVTYYVSNSNLSQTETTFTPSISPSVTNSNKPQFTETPSLLSFSEIVEKLQSFTESHLEITKKSESVQISTSPVSPSEKIVLTSTPTTTPLKNSQFLSEILNSTISPSLPTESLIVKENDISIIDHSEKITPSTTTVKLTQFMTKTLILDSNHVELFSSLPQNNITISAMETNLIFESVVESRYSDQTLPTAKVNCGVAFAKCGGLGFTGAECCITGLSCVYKNEYFSH